jgi:hypothetical protein
MNTLQVLLIIAFILIGIRKAYQKAKGEQAGNPDQIPVDKEEEQEAPARPKFRPVKTLRTETVKPPPPASTSAETPFSGDDTMEVDYEDFSISSPQDAARAIVWAEILQRKY